jgi:hypothetical protein
MKQELADHFLKVRDIIAEVDRIVASGKYPDDSATVVLMGLISTVFQHHRSVLLLISSGSVRSAFALIRDIVDGMYAGLWIMACAGPDELRNLKTVDRPPMNLPEVIKEVDAAYQRDTFFKEAKERWGAPLYRANRADIWKLGRWVLETDVRLEHNEKELADLTNTATASIIVLASAFLDKQKHPAEAEAVRALAKKLAA